MRSTTRLNWMRFYIQSWRRGNVESRASVTLPHLECDRPMRGLEWRTLTNQRLVCPGQCHARWTGLILSNCNTLVTVRQSGHHRPMRGLKRKRLTNQRPCSTRNSEAMQWPGAVTRIAQWEGIEVSQLRWSLNNVSPDTATINLTLTLTTTKHGEMIKVKSYKEPTSHVSASFVKCFKCCLRTSSTPWPFKVF